MGRARPAHAHHRTTPGRGEQCGYRARTVGNGGRGAPYGEEIRSRLTCSRETRGFDGSARSGVLLFFGYRNRVQCKEQIYFWTLSVIGSWLLDILAIARLDVLHWPTSQ